MTTKEQERKAMEKIREIVKGLGEYSYIASAMEGVWEIMEENINNDFAISMGDRMKEKDKEIESLKMRVAKADSDLYCVNDNIKSMNMKLSMCDKEIVSLTNLADKNEETIHNLTEDIAAKDSEKASLCMENARLKDEIIHLKAKLYDLITKEA